MALFPGIPGWASTRKVKSIWILLKQETVSGSGISWAICKSASRSRLITTPVLQYSTTQVFYRPDALPAAQPTASKHWRDSSHNQWYRFPCRELRDRVGIDDIALVLQPNKLRWYGCVLLKDDWVKKGMKYEVEGHRPRGRPKRTWTEVVEKDC